MSEPDVAESAPDARAPGDPTATPLPVPARPPSGPRQRGRRIARGLYYAMITAVGLAAVVEISGQVLGRSQAAAGAGAPVATCHQGLRALYTAVEVARREAPGNDGEDAALDRFRAALEGAWRGRDAVAASCKGSAEDEGTLDAIERLRYAEEHAVRREASDLAPLRRRVQAIVDGELSTDPAPPGRGPSRASPTPLPPSPAPPPRPAP